jgi:carboxymethylenebutenolidase
MSLHTSTVDIQTRDGVADGFVAAPDDGAQHPGVLFYMDAIGLRPRLEEMAERLAEQGYVVLVPNVFYRHGPAPLIDTSNLKDPEARAGTFSTLMPMIEALTPDKALSDADAYFDFLRTHPQVSAGPIGVTGYCMGGALALRTAAHRPRDVAAVAAFHPGRLVTDAADSPHRVAAGIRGEVYVASADGDQGMPPEHQQQLDEALTAAAVRHTCVQYDGARHGFTMSDTAVYDEAATERHWEALTDLFGRNLT